MNRQKELQRAITLLDEQELYSPATQIMWVSIRSLIFYYLEEKRIDFNSTQEAILLFISNQDSIDVKCSIYNVYTSSILIEWDINTSMTKNEYEMFKQNCLTIKETISND
ncbi:MAG: hypothetical protein GYB55_17560 [Cytophagales bacterium]|nr:hypothetical protein [Cytophagales bacterium]